MGKLFDKFSRYCEWTPAEEGDEVWITECKQIGDTSQGYPGLTRKICPHCHKEIKMVPEGWKKESEHALHLG